MSTASTLSFKHGITVKEEATRIVSPTKAESALPFVVGVAPVHNLAEDVHKPINEPMLVQNLVDFEMTFGKPSETDNEEDFTLWQFANIYFRDYKCAPIVAVNIFDPAKHAADGVPDVAKITTTDIIGGTDGDGNRTGLELVHEVYPRFRLTPALIVAPKWSAEPAVAKAITASCQSISGYFNACGIIEIPDSVVKYSDVPAYMSANNLRDTSGNTFCFFGDFINDGKKESGAAHLAGCLGKRDVENDSIPYYSPSNFPLEAYGMCHAGKTLNLTPAEAQYLNSQGIVTGLNMNGSLRSWGNMTAAFPESKDVKESVIPIRRMFNWIGNTLVLTMWKFIDMPVHKRMLQTVQDTVNYWLNSLAARNCILDGRCDFEEADNSITDLLDGNVRWHIYITPPNAANHLEFILEYDPSALETLFA